MSRPASGSFIPNTAGTITHSVTTTSTTPKALVGGGCDLLITNVGSSEAFFNIGDSTVTVSASTGTPILAGAILCVGRPPKATHFVAVTAASTATVRVTTGEGS